jgi:hypothetical protein
VQELAEDSTGAVVQDAEWEGSDPEETQEGEERQFWSVSSCGGNGDKPVVLHSPGSVISMYQYQKYWKGYH